MNIELLMLKAQYCGAWTMFILSIMAVTGQIINRSHIFVIILMALIPVVVYAMMIKTSRQELQEFKTNQNNDNRAKA